VEAVVSSYLLEEAVWHLLLLLKRRRIARSDRC
jgi:hypothetical protein